MAKKQGFKEANDSKTLLKHQFYRMHPWEYQVNKNERCGMGEEGELCVDEEVWLDSGLWAIVEGVDMQFLSC